MDKIAIYKILHKVRILAYLKKKKKKKKKNMYIYYIHSGNDIEQMLPYQKFNGGTGTRIVYLFFRVVCCEPLIKKKKKKKKKKYAIC